MSNLEASTTRPNKGHTVGYVRPLRSPQGSRHRAALEYHPRRDFGPARTLLALVDSFAAWLYYLLETGRRPVIMASSSASLSLLMMRR